MSESAPEGGQQDDPRTGEEDSGGNQPTFTQADLEKKIAERLAQERKKYSDYGDLKKKASEFDKLAEQQKTEAEKAVEAARLEGRSEAMKAANDQLLKAKIEASAARRLADPADAVRLLDLASFKVGDGGEIDGSEIDAAVDELVKAKPYLAAQQPGSGDGYGGPRGGKPGGPPQITSRAELRRMSPAAIVQARKEGRLDRLLGAKE